MVFALFCCISWLLVSLFAGYPKQLDRREGIFLFLVVLDLNINTSWVIGYELKCFELPKTTTEYLAYLMHRTVIVPLLPVMFVNWMKVCRSLPVRALLAVAYIAILMLVEVLCTSLNVYTFVKWGYLHSFVMYALYLVIAFLLLKWFRSAFAKEGPVR